MIIKGDKIELVKETRAFKKIGTKFEVDRIDEDGNITFNFRSCDCICRICKACRCDVCSDNVCHDCDGCTASMP